MRVHHLDCLTMCPIGGPLVGAPTLFGRGRMCCHVLLVETDAHGLVIVDTAIGLDDCASPHARLGGAFTRVLLPNRPDPAQTAVRQVEALGFSPKDVRNVIVTHLDLDHAGGLPDFPHAAVHLLAAEREAALAPQTFMERERYKAAHWAHGPRWETYAPAGAAWRGFEAVRELRGLPPEILLVPLTGHTRGHACVAIETSEGALVHAGDAYFHRNALRPEAGTVPAGLRLFEGNAAIDKKRVAANHVRLGELARDPAVRVFSAHDPVELEAMIGSARAA